MSPEQARGEPATAASDMYSFGLLLAELYSGKPAYGSGANALVRAQWGDVAPPRGIDRAVGALVGRLTTLDPQRRPSAQETLERLRVIQRRPLRRLRNAAVAIAAAGLVIGTGLRCTAWLRPGARPRRPRRPRISWSACSWDRTPRRPPTPTSRRARSSTAAWRSCGPS